MRPVQVTPGRHPFEVAVLGAALGCGLLLAVTGHRPLAVAAAMPTVLHAAWESGLVAAGAVGLVGVWWRGQLVTGMGVEVVGVVLLGTVTTMHAVALTVVGGMTLAVPAVFAAAVAGGAWARAWQIHSDLRRLVRAAAHGATANVTVLAERPET